MMYFLDKHGWPVETIRGRPALNFLRRVIHTRRVVKWWSAPQRIDVSLGTTSAHEDRGNE